MSGRETTVVAAFGTGSPAEDNVAADLTFRGTLPVAEFCAQAEARAERLSLGMTIHDRASDAIRLSISGPELLVDAFELAMSLGPNGCIVTEIERR